jgi:hypothetical protein
MEVLFWVRVEFFDIVLGKTHHWEKEVGDKGIQMGLEVSPHLLWSNTFV